MGGALPKDEELALLAEKQKEEIEHFKEEQSNKLEEVY